MKLLFLPDSDSPLRLLSLGSAIRSVDGRVRFRETDDVPILNDRGQIELTGDFDFNRVSNAIHKLGYGQVISNTQDTFPFLERL